MGMYVMSKNTCFISNKCSPLKYYLVWYNWQTSETKLKLKHLKHKINSRLDYLFHFKIDQKSKQVEDIV